jgi:hypothetical protein
MLPVGLAMRLEGGRLLLLLFTVQVPFFLAQWVERHTHQLPTNVTLPGGLQVGVSEGQVAMILIQLLFVFNRGALFLIKLPCIGSTIGDAVLTVAVMGAIWTVRSYIACVWKSKTPSQKSMGELTDAMCELVPLVQLVSCTILWSSTISFWEHPWLSLSTIGLCFSHLSTQMIVSRVSGVRFRPAQPSVALITVGTFFTYTASYKLLDVSPIIVLSCLLEVSIEIGLYVSSVIAQLTDALKISCFSIAPRPASTPTPAPAPTGRAASSSKDDDWHRLRSLLQIAAQQYLSELLEAVRSCHLA